MEPVERESVGALGDPRIHRCVAGAILDRAVVLSSLKGQSSLCTGRLAYPDAKLLVLEKESGVAIHQTGNNSGVIHSGIYYKPGSYKARNCVDGRHQLVRFCRENDVAHDICGKVIVATHDEEVARLIRIFDRGVENGIEGIRLIDRKEFPGFRSVKIFVRHNT